jgi:VWFA-related protein
MRARQQMIEYMGKIEPGTMMAVFTLSSRLQMVTGFTTDVAQLTRAVKGQKAETPTLLAGVTAPDALDSTQGYIDDLLNANSMGGPAGSVLLMQQFQADIASQVDEQRARMTLAALKELALYLSAIPGRKNLIWFSGSFPAAFDPVGSQAGNLRYMPSYSEDVRKTDDLLMAARVAVYPVDARGLMTQLPYDVSSRSAAGLGAFNSQLEADKTAMRQIAYQTGGQAYLDTNGLKEAVASAVENGGSYYTLAYTPPPKKLDGQFHKIEVRLDGAGDELSYRRGYYADAPGKSAPLSAKTQTLSPFLAASMHGAPPATQILFVSRVLAANDPQLAGAKLPDGPAGEMTASIKGPTQRYIADLKIDAHTLTFEPMPNGVRQAEIECVLVGYDADGKRLNWEDGSYTIPLDGGQYAAILARGLPMRMALDLPAGHVFLRIAIHDRTADHSGALEVPLAVAAK